MAEKLPKQEEELPGITKYWATKIVSFSSQYDDDQWPATEALGPPKVYPKYGDCPGAWAPGVLDDAQFIEVGFPDALFLTRIDIYETFHAGGIKRISARMPGNQWHTLYQCDAVSVIGHSRIFSPSIPSLSCKVNALRIEVDCTASQNWVEIDAVEIHGHKFGFDIPPSLSQLSDDMASLVNNKEFSDVQFVVEEHSIYGHKAILCARSHYFRAMFAEGTKESRYNSREPINIPGSEYDVFLALLHYLYTHTLPNDSDPIDLVKVINAADQYNIIGLKSFATIRVCEKIDVENVVDIYVETLHQQPLLEDLQKNCLDFISKNLNAVSKLANFANLPKEVLLEIVQRVAANISLN